jgi:hypothetical protein
VLAGENDKAFALLDAFDEAQRKQAILKYKVADLVLGPGHDGESIVPEGLKGSAMTVQQRALLLDVISERAGIVNDACAKPRMAEIETGLDDTYFAWSGPTTHEPGRNGSSYRRHRESKGRAIHDRGDQRDHTGYPRNATSGPILSRARV